ncbi:MAG: YifB family Mg chelatase-like AAA ATPase [Treponema sp.]|nr:YifB family Mg chelatase-like AAA ATPase [Treponema sp.]
MSVFTYMPYGAGGIIIRVESDIRRGIPGIDISGLAEGAVREARDRVRAAFRNSGFNFPMDRILINLAPAGLKKDGAALDLPIALSVMAAAGLAPVSGNLLVMGELELSGKVRPVRGALAAIAAGLNEGITEFIVPAENAKEAAILAEKGARFIAAENLANAVHALFIREEKGLLPVSAEPAFLSQKPADYGDFADVKGQAIYKRALEVAAAGGHNVLVFGPPGAGKTMLARRIPSVMTALTPDEAVEVTRLHSLAGPRSGGFIESLITSPPLRAPHHTASAEGILGGGRIPRPGEISLAHFGVLFLDEAPEFRINVLQALREPLEDRVISIVRADGPVLLPAEFQLLLTANSCRCGRLGIRDTGSSCLCSNDEISRYWRKFGGALLDRVEIRAAVHPPKIDEMGSQNHKNTEETSAVIALRVKLAVEIQRNRFKGTEIRRNALLPAGKTAAFCPMSEKCEKAFHTAIDKLGLSGRAYHGILRVGRTIADLEGKEVIETEHILEAVQHRRLGDDPWDILSI